VTQSTLLERFGKISGGSASARAGRICKVHVRTPRQAELAALMIEKDTVRITSKLLLCRCGV